MIDEVNLVGVVADYRLVEEEGQKGFFEWTGIEKQGEQPWLPMVYPEEDIGLTVSETLQVEKLYQI